MLRGDSWNDGISASEATIKTYSNYNDAWCLRTQQSCSLGAEQSRLEAFQKLKPSPHCDRETVKGHFLRGHLTLSLMQQVPVDEMPEFAMASALWLPVQAYYAVHGFGLAILAANGNAASMPQSHSAFMKVAAERIVDRLFPQPFSAVLRRGYDRWKHLHGDLTGVQDSRGDIRSGLNLEHPGQATREAHIAQCLDTTRRRLIEGKLEDARTKARKSGKRVARLSSQQQAGIADSVGPTTVFDYLYRVRIKSNYEDTTMYQQGSEHGDMLIELVKSTQELAKTVCALLANALWQSLDNSVRDELKAQFEASSLLRPLGAAT